MTYFTENLMQENRKYKQFIEDFQLGVDLYPETNNTKQFVLNMKDQNELDVPDKLSLNKSVWNPRKPRIPDSKHSFNFKENCFKKVNIDTRTRKSQALKGKPSTFHLYVNNIL